VLVTTVPPTDAVCPARFVDPSSRKLFKVKCLPLFTRAFFPDFMVCAPPVRVCRQGMMGVGEEEEEEGGGDTQLKRGCVASRVAFVGTDESHATGTSQHYVHSPLQHAGWIQIVWITASPFPPPPPHTPPVSPPPYLAAKTNAGLQGGMNRMHGQRSVNASATPDTAGSVIEFCWASASVCRTVRLHLATPILWGFSSIPQDCIVERPVYPIPSFTLP
jgi:hypothetical protein